MQGKAVRESIITMSQVMSPQDVNLNGNVHGGVIMKLIDITAGTAAMRHARCNIVTASIDRLDFISPVYPGNLVTFKASINYIGKTSMEVGVRVETEDLITGELRHTASAYLTFVALGRDRRPIVIPPLILETEDEKRRYSEALSRREVRLHERPS